MPWPVRRKVRPAWVPGRDLEQDAALERLDLDLGAEERLLEGQRELALEVGAAPREAGIRQLADDDEQVAAAGRPAGEPDPGPGVGAARDGDLEALAVDLDQARRAVIRLGQADLGPRFMGRRRRGPGVWATSSSPADLAGPLSAQAHPGQDVVEAEPADRAGGATRTAGLVSRLRRFVAEEGAEEVGELARVAARPELVADVAAGTGASERAARGPTGARPADLLPVRAELVVLLGAWPGRRGPRWPR